MIRGVLLLNGAPHRRSCAPCSTPYTSTSSCLSLIAQGYLYTTLQSNYPLRYTPSCKPVDDHPCTMDSSTEVSPSSEAANTEGVAQAEAETIELSPLSTSLASITDAVRPQSGNSPSLGSTQSQRASATWSIVKLLSFSTFYSIASRSSGLLGRYKTSIYKNSFKILGLLCGLGALTLAWIALKSPTNPDDIDIQSLAALNKSADSQMAIYKVL